MINHEGHEETLMMDDYAEGKDTDIIDLVLVGNIDPYHLDDLSRNMNVSP